MHVPATEPQGASRGTEQILLPQEGLIMGRDWHSHPPASDSGEAPRVGEWGSGGCKTGVAKAVVTKDPCPPLGPDIKQHGLDSASPDGRQSLLGMGTPWASLVPGPEAVC